MAAHKRRGWQLDILQRMSLPAGERTGDKDNRPVKPVEMAAVLRAIDDRAREHGWYTRELKELAAESRLSLRQLKRTLKVLRRLGYVTAQAIQRGCGATLYHWRVVFQDIARANKLPLWPEGEPNAQSSDDRVPTRARSECPIGHEPSAHAGTQEAPLEAPLEAPPPKTWEEVEIVLRESGLGDTSGIVRDAQDLGASPAEMLERLNIGRVTIAIPKNIRRLTSPHGALAWFVVRGHWPAGRIVSPEDEWGARIAEGIAAADACHDYVPDDVVIDALVARGVPKAYLALRGLADRNRRPSALPERSDAPAVAPGARGPDG